MTRRSTKTTPWRSSLLLAVFATACGDSGPPPDPVARTDTLPDGRIEVSNTGVPTWDEETAWRLVEDLRLGGAEDPDDPEQFSFIGDLAADAEGRIYVLETLSPSVRVFDASGAHLYTAGSEGEGPGELLRPAGLMLSADGYLWVADPGTRRFSVFDREGGLVAMRARPTVRQVDPWSGRFLEDGSLLDWQLDFPAEEPGVVAGSRIHFVPLRFSADMGRVDTLPPFGFSQDMLRDGSRPLVFFSNRLRIVPDRRGDTWFAETREYRVGRRALSGDTVLTFTLGVEPELVGESDREMVRERAGPEQAGAYLESLPATKPVVVDLFGDDAGHLFVLPEVAGVAAASAIDVFTEEGRYLGRMTLPRPISTRVRPVATREHLYLVELDDFDVPYVSRLRIIR